MKVSVIVGNVGTGKSTWVKENSNNALVWNSDFIRRMFHSGEYIYSPEENTVCFQLRDFFIKNALKHSFDIVIDDTNITKGYRSQIINLVKDWASYVNGKRTKIECIDFGKGNDTTLQRRIKNSRGDHDWKSIHEHFQSIYEKPELSEGIDNIIEVRNYGN